MPYILLALGLLLFLYAMFRFFMKAGPKEIKAAFLAIGTVAFAIALFFMAVTGRLPAALALVAALLPFLPVIFRRKPGEPPETTPEHPAPQPMNRSQALQILGLSDDADDKAVKTAYKNLMKKMHPDQEGSDWLAAKLNEARDFLLNNK